MLWGLFSISHDHYQPNNNLIILYDKKPSFDDLRLALYSHKEIEEMDDKEFIIIANLLQEKEVEINIYDADFRLEQVKIGELLEEQK